MEKKINIISKIILGLAFVSYIYLICCPIIFAKSIYATFFNQIPFALLLVIDLVLLWKNRENLLDIFKLYINKNKALFISVAIFLLYDIVTLLYALTPEYSVMKYVYFFKAMVLIGSMFLYSYDKWKSSHQGNFNLIIHYMEIIFLMIIITTVIKYCLGVSPYWSRISMSDDYNVYATYLMYTLVFFIWNHIKKWKEISVKRKIFCIIISTFSFDLLYLSGSRRAVVLTPFIIALSSVIFAIKEKIFFNIKEGKIIKEYKKIVLFICVLAFVIVNVVFSVPVFEKEIATPNMYEKFVGKFFPKEFPAGHPNFSGDTLLSTRYETINRGEGFESRKLIWEMAFAELREYKGKDLVFGRGNGYGWNLYEEAENEGVKAILAAYPHIKHVYPKWMSPHNLVLKEMLDGGIIKLILLLVLTGVLLDYVIKIMKNDLIYGSMFMALYCCFAAGCMLGGEFGLVGEKLFWLTTGILVLYRCEIKNFLLSKTDMISI